MTGNRRDKTILIIEDDADVQNFISKVLELEGYTVLKANDGIVGMRLMKENKVSLVLLDLRLPGPDGWSILRTLKRHSEYSSIPVVVLTAIAESIQRRKTLRMGATQYLIKPLSAHRLSQTIARVLQQENSTQGISAGYARQSELDN